MRPEWKNARKIIIKIGSSLLVDKQEGRLKQDWLAALAEDVEKLLTDEKQVIIVSSGAIALGRRALGLRAGPLKLEQSQAAAAAGQVFLTQAYQSLFARHNRNTAQILVTLDDTEERARHINARNTIETLLSLGAIPIVNENDSVATQEIRYGDNDRLAARVASMTQADCLVLLSDIDGLYSGPPGSSPDVHKIDSVEQITPKIEAMAGSVGSDYGSGGMITKLAAGKIAMQAGTHMVITSGLEPHPLRLLDNPTTGTWFLAQTTPGKARKRWIAGSLKKGGQLIIDQGASQALENGRSLLAAGITKVVGEFDRGETVHILAQDGTELAYGICAYSSKNVQKILGRKSSEFTEILGYPGRSNVIHRNDLVLVGNKP